MKPKTSVQGGVLADRPLTNIGLKFANRPDASQHRPRTDNRWTNHAQRRYEDWRSEWGGMTTRERREAIDASLSWLDVSTNNDGGDELDWSGDSLIDWGLPVSSRANVSKLVFSVGTFSVEPPRRRTLIEFVEAWILRDDSPERVKIAFEYLRWQGCSEKKALRLLRRIYS